MFSIRAAADARPSTPPRQVRPGRVVGMAAVIQVSAGLGFYAVLAHLVRHLHRDLGSTPTVVGLVLGTRALAQYALHLPAGALVDRLGAARAGALACLVRAAGFAVLAVAAERFVLIVAAVLIGVGGSVYTPAGQALLAGLPQGWPPRGFAWYTAAGQVAAIGGPLLGLALLDNQGLPTAGAGFARIAWLAAGLWLTSGVLLSLLPPPEDADRSGPHRTVGRAKLRVAVRDPGLHRLAASAWPATLLITQAAVVVPQLTGDSTVVAAYLMTGAAMTAAVQLPVCRPFAVRYGLIVGFAGFAMAYFLLAITATVDPAPAPFLLIISGTSYGVAQGLLVRALFQRITQTAPAGAVGSYAGALQFLTGVVAFAGSLAIGVAFEHGWFGAFVATLALAVSGAAASWISGRAGYPVTV